jgi:hypothetical protein
MSRKERLTWKDGDVRRDPPTWHVPADVLAKMIAAIRMGTSAADSGLVHTPDEQAAWDDLTRDIENIRASGGEVEVPDEWIG